MTAVQNTKEAILSEEKFAEKAKEPSKTPVPTATGNEKVEILRHCLVDIDTGDRASHAQPGLELAIRNVSDSTVATVVFEAVFYDQEGNVVDTAKHLEVALEPDRSRAILIGYPPYDYEKVKSYNVSIIRTTTADVEKVQLRRHEITTTETGEEEISGIAKNISTVKTDAAVIATFYNANAENIGTKVLILRDIEPNSIRQYVLKFKPQEGDSVRTYNIEIGELAE